MNLYLTFFLSFFLFSFFLSFNTYPEREGVCGGGAQGEGEKYITLVEAAAGSMPTAEHDMGLGLTTLRIMT